MRICISLSCCLFILFFTDLLKAEETEDDEGMFGEKSYGNQEVEHESELQAFVMKPPNGFGSDDALDHFRQLWKENEQEGEGEQEEEEQEFFGNPHLAPFLPKESDDDDNEEPNYDTAGSTSENPPIDPNDPEEKGKAQQIENQHLFSRILTINNELHVTGVFEGDMRFVRNRNAGGDSDTWDKSRSGPMAGLVPIPYKISVKYNKTEVDVIKSAMALYTKHTCIRFVPRKTEISYIYITDAKGCWAYVGKTGYSAQTVSLGRPGCVAKGIAAHEFMHVVGFQHEHSRSDRDKYVTVLEHNIIKDMKPNFEVHKNTKNLVIYDYNSVMHYSKNAFSKYQYLPAIQITPKRKPEPEIGQRERMSPYDIEEIKYLYNCASGTYQRCGRDFMNSRGDTFTSPRHPNPYPAEAHCTWKITVPKGLYISLTITNLDIEDSKLCQKDAILIHDGPDAAAPQLKVVCGTKSEATTILSTGNNLFVMFTSNPSSKGTFKGFKASFKTSHSKGVLPKPLTIPTLKPIRSALRTFSCDFDSGTCGMTQDTLDEIDWIRYKGATPSQGTGPRFDHTSGNGYYMYVESSLPSKLGDNAILRTPWLYRSRMTCVSFSYHMLGAYMGTLRLFAFEKRKSDRYGHEVLLWERHENQGNQWHEEDVLYKPKADVEYVQFYWEAFVFFYQSDFGLDDISIKNTGCLTSFSGATTTQRVRVISPTTRPTTKPATVRTTRPTTTAPRTTPAPVVPTSPVSAVSCDFDSGFCGWTQENEKDDFDWIREMEKTPSQNTGPTGDHTSGKGYFLFIEASSPRIDGDVARLVSPPLTTKPHCLKMWYHMYGSQMGSLIVRQITDNVDTKLIEKSGNRGNQWHYLEIDIITPSIKTAGGFRNARLGSEKSMHIAIDAVRGSGYPGDLAIDDVEITSSTCASQPAVVTTPPSQLQGVTCDFESHDYLCGFTSGNADFDWTKNTGSTQSSSTGPDADHTKGDDTGSYMYIEASSPRKMGHRALLVSPKIAPGRYCVRFYVHMWGSGMGEVNVNTTEYGNDDKPETQRRWGMKGSQPDSWLQGEFDFESALNIKYIQVAFEGVIGHSFTSDAAIDDISITSGRCRDNSGGVRTTAKPTTTKRTTRPTTTKRTTTPRPTTTKRTTTPKPTTTKRTTTPRPTTTKRTTTPRPTTTKRTTTTRPTTTTKRTTTTRPTTTKSPTTTTRRITRPRTTKRTTTTKPTTTTRRPVTTRRPTIRRPTTTRMRPTTTTPRPTTTRKTVPPTTKPKPSVTAPPGFGRGRPRPKKAPTSAPIAERTTKQPNLPTTDTSDGKLAEFSCDFETDKYCGMLQLNDDNFDWIRHTGNTRSSGTGPMSDHTNAPKDTGHYLYIEGSEPRLFNDNAVIATPALSTTPTERCVTFWYHMYGNGVGDIRVYSELARNGVYKKYAMKPNKQMEFEVTGNKGNVWKMVSFGIRRTAPNKSATLRLHFEAVRGKSFRSDVAIDDICITSTPCDVRSKCQPTVPASVSTPAILKKIPTKPPRTTRPRSTRKPIGKKATAAPVRTTTPKPPITKETTTTPAPTQSQDDLTMVAGMPIIMPRCTFDVTAKKSAEPRRVLAKQQSTTSDVLCGWEQDKRDDFDWSWTKGTTPSTFTGPNGDHTTGKGHFLFIESSAPNKKDDIAVLKSPKMYPTAYCIDMYYSMYGRSIGALFVRANQEMTDKPRVLSNLKVIKGPQGQAWGHLKLNYRPRGTVKNVQFRVEGQVGRDYTGDIAIDDVSITPGRCDSCLRPNKKFKDRFGQEKSFVTGCIHSGLFYVKCCGLADEKIAYQKVTKCNPNALPLERLNWICYHM